MKRKPGKPRTKKPPPLHQAPPEQLPESAVDVDADRVFARPDGYHWVALDGKQDFGPFETIEQARADMDAGGDEEGAPTEDETLPELERDIGMAEWIDPETGEPAQGQSPPHLEPE